MTDDAAAICRECGAGGEFQEHHRECPEHHHDAAAVAFTRERAEAMVTAEIAVLLVLFVLIVLTWEW
jgi:hypothetical protein